MNALQIANLSVTDPGFPGTGGGAPTPEFGAENLYLPPAITARKRSCGKVMFLHLWVILFTERGVCIQACSEPAVYKQLHWCWLPLPPAMHVPCQPHHTCPCLPHTPPPSPCMPPLPSVYWDMVNKRAVRIPLECILVDKFLPKTAWKWKKLDGGGASPQHVLPLKFRSFFWFQVPNIFLLRKPNLLHSSKMWGIYFYLNNLALSLSSARCTIWTDKVHTPK